MWVQVLLSIIDSKFCLFKLKTFIISAFETFDCESSLIAKTWSSDKRQDQCFSPFGTLPFFLQSKRFSIWVPTFRWFGFTQGGLSQMCNMLLPLGIFPLCIS